ncbi:uncharacterized protein FFFS_15632 [Fusarium fujikuroi]|nr:uncharacterized protein FFFS_15632 [Fusarium fujikuroi]
MGMTVLTGVQGNTKSDSLAELSAASFIDATRVNPGVRDVDLTGCFAGHLYLFPACLASCMRETPHVLEKDFVSFPCVRQNGVVHSGQIAHGDKAPKVSNFGGITSGEDGKVVQQFRTPQDYRVTGGGVPQLAASAAPQIPQFYSFQAQGPTISPSANEIRLPARPSTHSLEDYQMQLMLLEQQNKKRLMTARSEQDTSVAEGSSDAAVKSNFSNSDTSPEPQTEQRVYQPPSCQPANQLAGAGIVPAVVRDV